MKNKEGNLSLMSKPIFIRRWFLFRLLPTLLVLAVGAFVLKCSMYKSNESVINYSENGAIDYKVYLRDNTYYTDEYLSEGMQYIANLIKKINITYNYNFAASEELDYTYKYRIKTNLIITDPNDNNKILYNKENVLTPDTKKSVSGKDFAVSDSIDIDYQEYNAYVNSFKKEYGLSIKSKLIVTMEVNTSSKDKVLHDKYDKTRSLLASIPLSEQTINIDTDTSGAINNGVLDKNYKYKIKSPNVLLIGIVIVIIGLILLYITVYTFFTSRTKIDLYRSLVDKILKEYDRAIVSSDSIESIKEENYNVIKVDEIDELLDAHDTTGQPILYSEIIPNELSCFEIVSNDILYRLEIDRKKLEEAANISRSDENIDDTVIVDETTNNDLTTTKELQNSTTNLPNNETETDNEIIDNEIIDIEPVNTNINIEELQNDTTNLSINSNNDEQLTVINDVVPEIKQNIDNNTPENLNIEPVIIPETVIPVQNIFNPNEASTVINTDISETTVIPVQNPSPDETPLVINEDVPETTVIPTNETNDNVVKHEKSCGAVVFTKIDGEVKYAIIQQLEGFHSFPKGHMEKGETEEETAKREIFEEIGIQPNFIKGFKSIEKYPIPQKNVMKKVVYFLAEYENQELKYQTEELLGVNLMTYEEALAILEYENLKALLTKANDFLKKKGIIDNEEI